MVLGRIGSVSFILVLRMLVQRLLQRVVIRIVSLSDVSLLTVTSIIERVSHIRVSGRVVLVRALFSVRGVVVDVRRSVS